MILCPKCSAAITNHQLTFCPQCKTVFPQTKICKQCKETIPFTFSYCPYCGNNCTNDAVHWVIPKKKEITADNQRLFTDNRDKMTYKTVIIGDQEWMAENVVFDMPNAIAYYSSSEKAATYGLLYTWEDALKAVPEGFRLPNREDFRVLEQFCQRSTGLPAGTVLKSCTDDWCKAGALGAQIPGKDLFGFRALPAGLQNSYNVFNYLGNYAYFWTIDEKDETKAYFRHLCYFSEKFNESATNKNCAFSVRGIRIK